ncbi:unnamed protein product [Mycena citricolor]|uniref:Uncharacterized protein n=1 Tax=Mycena citricolor TaxID=2018698 RepID=A0AAD2H9P6_9AGAR|nr:unnamed protein product [Mycena citricolor]CAK5271552.1 unnamed protein product [Mycena citricolor]
MWLGRILWHIKVNLIHRPTQWILSLLRTPSSSASFSCQLSHLPLPTCPPSRMGLQLTWRHTRGSRLQTLASVSLPELSVLTPLSFKLRGGLCFTIVGSF